ncbi:GNAT family N-acetyltransferase [Granulicella arctica]|uniref:GNAT family N-acetyltransferase n=1 Tax=Granulicella arctica TaxID=940613 RepID=UPI0021E01FD9|nr:GNAT family N-acetyltransferase [Granulicella arctica]
MIEIVIAAARAEDIAEVVRVEREAVEAPHWAEGEYVGMVGAGAVRCLLVARRDGEIVGFAVGHLVGDEAELESVVVRALERRGGVGRALCRAVIAWAWESGGEVMDLEVRASSGAIALYRGLGFDVVGQRRGYYAAPDEDAVLMRLVRGVVDLE